MVKKIALMVLLVSSQLVQSASTKPSSKIKRNMLPINGLEILDQNEEKLSAEHPVERAITLAELNDLLKKVEEDLDELYYLNRPDTQELGRILEAKKAIIQAQLKSLELNIRNPQNSLVPSWVKIIIIGSSISLALIATGAGLMASYNTDSGWHSPTYDQLINNIQKIVSE